MTAPTAWLGRPACSAGVFIDVGANNGKSVEWWYTRHGCTERDWPCLFMIPAWLPLRLRQQQCALAFEPNPRHWKDLDKIVGVHNSSSHQILVHRAAFALDNGNMPFGLDNETKSQEGSSLALSKRTRQVVNGKPGPSGRGPEVRASTITVPTVDGVAFLWEVAARYGHDVPVSLKIDVEGFEFTLMRDLIVSGVLCSVVTNLFVEWHPSIDWKREGLPEEEPRLENVYKWLLRFGINRTGYEHVPHPTRHCRTTLMRWV